MSRAFASIERSFTAGPDDAREVRCTCCRYVVEKVDGRGECDDCACDPVRAALRELPDDAQHHLTPCAFCQTPTAPESLDHVDVPRGAVPICFGCLGELNEWADEHRAAAVDHEAASLPWEDACAANDATTPGKVA